MLYYIRASPHSVLYYSELLNLTRSYIFGHIRIEALLEHAFKVVESAFSLFHLILLHLFATV